jgi:hypothetical protein
MLESCTSIRPGHRLAARRHAFSTVVLVAVVLAVGCKQPSAETMSSQWERFADAYLEAYFAAHPAFAVTQGRHEFDGQFPDWSAEGIEREIERMRDQRRQALAFDGDSLTAEQRLERDHLVATADRTLFWLEDVEWPFRNPVFYFDWLLDTLDPNVYIARPYAPLAQRMEAYTLWAENLVPAAEQIRVNLRTPMPSTWVERGVSAFGGLASYFETDVPLAFSGVEDGALQERFAVANAAAAAAMRRLAGWLEEQLGEATEEFALGEELFRRMLWKIERVEMPLDELEELGRADLERNVAALERACAVFAPGADLQECMALAAANKPEGGVVEGARTQLAGLRTFIADNSLVSIPGSEEICCATRPELDAAGPGGFLAGSRGAIVHLGARGLAGSFPAVSARQQSAVEDR